ncbi:hypothetical protein BCV70DRAFT_200980 [Testicularia cyperi]|uniref:Uncharacterized protein n=1 Tax=Testicularia cyperi TaxID=1882483 RepID=A0A317XQ45_9BASI|nr:hypothetical protein BCV70DRAFT_200980 [Testicularia cyperi]
MSGPPPNQKLSAAALSPFGKNSQNAATLSSNGSSAKPSAAALSPFGKNSQNAATLGKGSPSEEKGPKKGPSTPKGSKTAGGGGNRSISLSARSSPGPSSRAGSGNPMPGPSTSMFDPTGLLSRDQETTYHRQFRTALQTFMAAARTWEEVATFDGLKWAKEALDSWNDIYAAQELGKASKPGSKSRSALERRRAQQLDPRQALDPITGPGGLRETRIADALQRIELAQDGLDVVMERLNKALAKLTNASDTLRNIMEEAAERKGLEFAFQQSMWGTWSMDQFVEKTADLTSQYHVSTSHLGLLVPTLLRSGEPARKPSSSSKRIDTASVVDESHAQSQSHSQSQSHDPNAARRSAYETWIALPYLDTRGHSSLSWLEALCEVEVGRWRD